MKKSDYKTMFYSLKHQYEAKVRLLAFYKTILSLNDIKGNSIVKSDKEQAVNKFLDKEWNNLYHNTKYDARFIHLTRAFIKGIPYSKVEHNPVVKVNAWSIVNILEDFGYSHHNNYSMFEEVKEWIESDTPSKVFAKPVVAPSFDANGSPV